LLGGLVAVKTNVTAVTSPFGYPCLMVDGPTLAIPSNKTVNPKMVIEYPEFPKKIIKIPARKNPPLKAYRIFCVFLSSM